MNRTEWLDVGKEALRGLIAEVEAGEAASALVLRNQRDALIQDIEAGAIPSVERGKLAIDSLVHSAGNIALRTAEGSRRTMIESLVSIAETALIKAIG